MIQRRLEEQLHDYLAGALDETARREVEATLANSADARALCEEIREAQDALAILRDRTTPKVPLNKIQLAIASTVFAGRPEPDMHAWGNRFYKRVAAAAVLLCGLSIGVAVHSSLRDSLQGQNSRPVVGGDADAKTDATLRAPLEPSVFERGVDVTGEITAFELMNQNEGNLVTFTPTDAVEPTYESSGGASDGAAGGASGSNVEPGKRKPR